MAGAAANPFIDPADLNAPAVADAPQPKAVRTEPITDQERIVLNNFFDTQPARRAAYLKRIGLEMDPKDDNKVRPLGSDGPFNAEIDPGYIKAFKKGGLKGLVEEAGVDIGGLAHSLMLQGPLVGGAAMAGAGAGTGAGLATGPASPIAAPVLGVIGGILGGAAGNVASEGFKKAAGDLLLDDNIPLDKGPLAVQSLLTGTMPYAFKGGQIAAGKVIQETLGAVKGAISRAASISGGQITPELLNKAATAPEMFTPEAVSGATGRLKEMYSDLFGTTIENPRSTRQIDPNSDFGKFIQPLNQQATDEINSLSKDPKANWQVGEIVGPMKSALARLQGKFDRTADEDAAVTYLKNKIESIYSKVAPEEGASYQPTVVGKTMGSADEQLAKKVVDPITGQVASNFTAGTEGSVSKKINPNVDRITGKPLQSNFDPDQAEINYKQGREILKAIQDDAFDREVPGSSTLKQVAGGNANGLRSMADAKAAALGSDLPQINAQRSQVLQAYTTAQKELTPSKLSTAFLGDDSVNKQIVRDTLGLVDQNLGTNYAQKVEDGSMQRVVENLFNNPKSYGSGRALTSALIGGGSGASMGAGAGMAMGSPGLGAALGGLAGAAGGAVLSNPNTAFGMSVGLGKADNALSDYLAQRSATEAPSMASSMLGTQVSDQIAPAVNRAMQPAPSKNKKLNPFISPEDQ